jgi:hypothetical protein
MLSVWFLFFFENLFFPNQHQEYGVLELASWDRGEPFAEPSLLRFADDQMGRPVDRTMVAQFSLPVPAWVYPVWAAAGALIVLVVVRNLIGRHGTATAVAGSYVVYRAMMWLLLAGTGFPRSAVPFFLLAGAVCVDVAFMMIPRRPVLGAALAVAGVYGGLAVQAEFLVAPPFTVASLPFAFGLLAVLWYGALRLSPSRLSSEPPVRFLR